MAASSDSTMQFMQKLKEFGKEKVKKLKTRSGKNDNEYIVACIASEEEIENSNNNIIENAEYELCKKDGYYLSQRVVVIRDSYYWHGEARLLDPTREIWKRVADSEQGEREMVFSKRDLIGEMKANFRLEGNGDPKIWLWGYYNPCTEDRHRCARLIKEYVKASGDKFILSYEQTSDDTDEEEACKILSGKHVRIIQPWKQQQEDIDEEVTSYSERIKRQEKQKRKRKDRESTAQQAKQPKT